VVFIAITDYISVSIQGEQLNIASRKYCLGNRIS
jgi:hypothetical protein